MGPLSFSHEGRMVNQFFGEVRPGVTSADSFGDRLILAFTELTEGESPTPLVVKQSSGESCPCFEYAKAVIGPEQLKDVKYETTIYSYSDGLAAMLNDRPQHDDE